MLNLVVAILGILITILLIVGIHEFGHFIMARMVGVKVSRFSIGFGRTLFHWYDKKNTEYVLAAIPLGGYVKLLDENEEDVPVEDLPYAFNRQPLYKRMAIIIAGPLSNLIFAFLIYWCLFIIGFDSIIPKIGKVQAASLAASAGLQPQQEILSINNQTTRDWTAVLVTLLAHIGEKEPMQIQVKNPDKAQPQTHVLNLAEWHLDHLKPDPLESLGITPFIPEIPALIGKIAPGSPAEQARLQVGDKVLAVDNKPIIDWFELTTLISENPTAHKIFTISRQGKIFNTPITIGAQKTFFSKKMGYLGIQSLFKWPKNLLRHNQYNVLAALSPAWHETVIFTELNFILIGKMFTGQLSIKSLGGPITIFQSAGTALNAGFIPFLSFLAFLSISIGIVNILPIPGLDGGHFLFQFIELITGNPVSLRVQTFFYRIGLIMLLLILSQAIANDLMRL